MMKAYPQSYDSSNYDIIKCWSCGCQVAAINVQATEDDYTLFNTIFFYQNQNCGYVLKPSKLLGDNLLFLNEVSFRLNIKIYTIFGLCNLINTDDLSNYVKKKVTMEVYSLGSMLDDNFPLQKFELVEGLVFPKILNNTSNIVITVHESALGCVMIKFKVDNIVIGRCCIPYCLMKSGYRRIPVYNNNCFLCEDVIVIGKFSPRKL